MKKAWDEQVLLAVPRSYPCVCSLAPEQATRGAHSSEANRISGMPFLLPYPGNGFYRCAQMLMAQAG